MSALCSCGAGYKNAVTVILDKTITMWNLTREDLNYGIAKKALRGHNHFVSDVVISSDGQFALSGSWDNTLRLWDLNTLVQLAVQQCVVIVPALGARLPEDLLAILKMYSVLHFLLTTDRLCLALGTILSSYGTLWECASILSRYSRSQEPLVVFCVLAL